MAVAQAVEAPQEKGLLPVIAARRTQPPALAQYRYGHVVPLQSDQHRDAPHQPHIIFVIGVLETAVEGFDGGVAELYPETHGCILQWSGSAMICWEIHPFTHGSQPSISNSFSEDL